MAYTITETYTIQEFQGMLSQLPVQWHCHREAHNLLEYKTRQMFMTKPQTQYLCLTLCWLKARQNLFQKQHLPLHIPINRQTNTYNLSHNKTDNIYVIIICFLYRGVCEHCHIFLLFFHGKQLLWPSVCSPGWHGFSKIRPTLKGKNLLQVEQILSF